MTRSPGVSAAGIVALLGSALAIGFALMMLFGAASAVATPANAPRLAVSPVLVLSIMATVPFMLAGWGIASAVGLFRLRNWARTSFIVFASLLLVFSCVGGLGMIAAIPTMSDARLAQSNLPRETAAAIVTATVGAMMAMNLVATGVAIWWLVLFNRANVREQFARGLPWMPAAAPAGPQRPAAVTVVACFLLLSVIGIPMQLLTPSAVGMLFGHVLRGWPALLASIAVGTVSFVAGLGLLLRRPAAHIVATALLAFSLANAVVSLVVPGAIDRLYDATRTLSPPDPRLSSAVAESMARMMSWGTLAISAIAATVCMVVLLSRRDAYLRACGRRAERTEVTG